MAARPNGPWMGTRGRSDETVQSQRLGPPELAFIAARDGFYLASVSETGWPYVQYRGGPAGFLSAVDDTTLASRIFAATDNTSLPAMSGRMTASRYP
jgi:predicted pyridoxine 5'-phosphate oxidase superfamily flavin-nucleotide-binding protein